MNYKEKVEWLKQVEPTLDSTSEEIKQQFAQLQSEVFTFESKMFEVIMNSLESELQQIDFITKSMETNIDSNYQEYADNEIARHRQIISEYGNQVDNLYTKDTIISVYESSKLACNERIEYSNRVLAENPEDSVSLASKDTDELLMNGIEHSLAVLKGISMELQDVNMENANQAAM